MQLVSMDVEINHFLVLSYLQGQAAAQMGQAAVRMDERWKLFLDVHSVFFLKRMGIYMCASGPAQGYDCSEEGVSVFIRRLRESEPVW